MSEVEAMLTLLNSDGRTLQNLKVTPGSRRDLTSDEMARAARQSLERVLAQPLVDEPPRTGMPKMEIGDVN